MIGAWGNGAAAPAVLARDALASSVDKQHEDDDEAVDHLPAGLGHFHDRKHAVEQHDQHHADQRAEVAAAAAQDVCAPITTAAIEGSR